MTETRAWTCPTHGSQYGEVPNSNRMAWDCPDCVKQANTAEQEHRASHHRHHWWLRNSGIPARYRPVRPSHVKPLSASATTLASAVAAYTANLGHMLATGEGMVLLGPPGLGKTLALTAIINHACQHIHGPRYRVWPDVLAQVKASFSTGRDDPRKDAVEQLRTCPLLALDEMGVKVASDFDHAELFGLVDYRYREGLPTLVAANCTRQGFAHAVGERIADRLLEQGPAIVLTGKSQRGSHPITGPAAFPEPPEEATAQVHSMGKWITRIFHAPETW